MKNQYNSFEIYAKEYDQWFDSETGARIFLLELGCLQKTVNTSKGIWLELGVGSGRFAHALGIETGVDPSLSMAKTSKKRGIKSFIASGENLPFIEASFDGVLLVCTLCFLRDPKETLRECWQVLKESGHLAIGFVPANSPWGAYHAMRGKQGHAFYSSARFYISNEIRTLAESVGFTYQVEHGCALPKLDSLFENDNMSRQIFREESFVVLSFTKAKIIKGNRT